MRHVRHGSPPRVLRAALAALADDKHQRLKAASAIVGSAPLGPSRRRYANAAALVKTTLPPPPPYRAPW